MVRPKGVRKGFTKLALSILRDDPSRTWSARELAEEALRRDPELSVAKNPLISLAATFEKQARENSLPDIEVVGRYPKRYRWRGGNSGNPTGSPGQPAPVPNQPSSAREYVTVTVGEAQFRGPVTAQNLDTAIAFLQRFKEKPLV
jgi:hypothetical protein